MQQFEEQSLDRVFLCPVCGHDMIPAMKFPCNHRVCDDCYTCLSIDDCPTCTKPGIPVPDPAFNLFVRRFQRERKYRCMRCKAMIQSEDQIEKHCCTRMNFEIVAQKALSIISDVDKEIYQAIQISGENILHDVSGYGKTTEWKLDEQGKLYTYVRLFDQTLRNRPIFLTENRMCGEAVTIETKPEVVFVYAKPDPMNIGKYEAEVAHPRSWENQPMPKKYTKRIKPNRHEIKRLNWNGLNQIKFCKIDTSICTGLNRMASRVARNLASI